MHLPRFAVVLATFALLVAPAAAQTALTLNDLDADRLNDTQIKIEFDYQGGACEKVEPAQVGEIVDGTLSLVFATTSTAEMCTMQVVAIEVEQSVEAGSDVKRVDITLLATDGSVAATGKTDVDAD